MNDLFNTQKEPTKKDVGRYKDGLKHGEWEEYYSTGEIKFKGTYLRGKRHGEWKIYELSKKDSKSFLKSCGSYENDVKQGLWKYFHNSWGIHETGVYEDGLKHGEWKSFYSCNFPVKSKLQSVGFYQHGIKHGKYVEYDKNGDIKSEDIFDNGQFTPTDKLGAFF